MELLAYNLFVVFNVIRRLLLVLTIGLLNVTIVLILSNNAGVSCTAENISLAL